MAKQTRKRDSALGGLAILAAAAGLCLRGLAKVEEHLRNKRDRTRS